MYNIETLAGLTGLTRRTIRYYIQRGLLEPPEGGGRGSFYTDEHLARLNLVKQWTEQGVPIIHMKAMLEGKTPGVLADADQVMRTVTIEKCEVGPGMELNFPPGFLTFEELADVSRYIKTILDRRNQ
ncbi:MAG: MerR family transcriptional regulator [Spirochaetales bacterium]|nr:MAG: MerR family transcriptional regulator [Spirochaetales bacterium]